MDITETYNTVTKVSNASNEYWENSDNNNMNDYWAAVTTGDDT